MLHYKAVDKSLLGLLNKLQAAPLFNGLRLVGGTALALQIGHRRSVDIDLFGNLDAELLDIHTTLKEIAPFTILRESKSIHTYLVDGIKTDIVNYTYQWLQEVLCEDDLKIAGKADIAAMKVAAITGRGSKKDFIDIYFLLLEFTLAEIFTFYTAKFPEASVFLALKSLVYFEDAEEEEMPDMFISVLWADIKAFIQARQKEYILSQQ